MFHIILLKQWDSISISVSLLLDNYTTDEVYVSQLLVPKTRVINEHARGAVGGDDVVCVVIHPYQMWFMSYITLIKQWDRISNQAWTTQSLMRYMVHALGSTIQDNS